MTNVGFVFDLDGVLCDTAKFHYLAWKNLGEKLGISIDQAFNEKLKGISRMESLERILAHGGKGGFYTQLEKTDLATQKNRAYVQLLEKLTKDDVLPGVVEFLTQARTYGIPCGVASASLNAPFILEKLEIADYFATVVDPRILRKGKPDPEIFLQAAAFLKVKPECAIGFEDAEAGVAGIKSAGMYAVGIGSPDVLPEADICVQSLSDLDFEWLLQSRK